MDENANEQITKLTDAVRSVPANLLKWSIIAVVILVVLYVVRRVLRNRKKPPEQAPDPAINVLRLSDEGPPAAGPSLSFYHVPVRLAAVVLAPAGRLHELPPVERLGAVIDVAVPGLAQVVTAHQPLIRKWPAQLSVTGFAHLFFSNARLPGDGGKGTPWCAAAGVFRIEKKPIVAGLVMRAAAPNNLGQAIIEDEAKWLDILRVKP